ncbi:MAG TPA: hypothetical protein VFL41_11295, partial [Gaiellaceae bacterium]|nr:hypothetical protein [Gaiellaceae bacterium]
MAVAFLFPATASAAPTLWTGKADYAPGEIVDVHGSGFAANTTYAMPVKRPDGSIVVIDPVTHVATPIWELATSDAMGNLTYNYQLDGIFGLYEARAYPADWQLGAGEGWDLVPVASTTFTDGPLPASVTLRNWETIPAPGAWVTATLGSSNSAYKEGQTIPFRLDLGTLSASSNPYTATICRDYYNGSADAYGYIELKPYATTVNPGMTPTAFSPAGTWTAGTFAGVNIASFVSVTETGGQGACSSATQRETIVVFNVTSSGPQYLLWGGYLAKAGDQVGNTTVALGQSAGNWPGGSLQMKLLSPAKTGGINPGAIAQLANITVKKVVDLGAATPDQWCFNISPNPNGITLPVCPAAGTDTVQFLGLDTGSYTITETTVAGYGFASGAGINCTFSGSTATASVTAAIGGATNASCTFHNAIQTGTLVVKKVVVNDNGGTKTAPDFSFKVDDGTATAFEADGQNDLTVNAGTYDVTEPEVAGYTTTYNNCTDVVVPAGGSATCTITNDDQPGTLIVKKVVVNDNGGTKAVTDFSFKIGSGNPITFEADGQNDQTVDAGTYNVTEPAVAGYATTYSNCTDVAVANGGSATCTVTNDDQPGTLVVKKVVVNDNGGILEAKDFTFEVNGDPAVAFEADGQNDLTVNAGTYDVTEPAV